MNKSKESPVLVTCAVTMMYLGPRMIKSNVSHKFKIHADEILILQAHTTNDTKSVFKGRLKPNDQFTFKSHRVIDHPFDITIYINGIIDQHIFVCCEKGFYIQANLQTHRNSCQLHSITGGIPCETCQSHDLMELFSDETQENDIESTEFTSVSQDQTHIKDDDYGAKKPIPSLYTTSTEYNQSQDSKKVQKSTDNQNLENEVDQQNNQSIGNIEALQEKTKELKQTDSNVKTKIMNEDNKVKIFSAARSQMHQLLFSYSKLLVSETKSNENVDKDKTKPSTTESFTSSSTKEMDRETKAKMQHTGSMLPVIVPTKIESFVLIWLDEKIGENYDTIESEEKLRAIVNSLMTRVTIDQVKYLIEKVEDQQIYLIVSGQLAKQIVSIKEIINCVKLNSIYIYCHNPSEYVELVQVSNKIVAVFKDIDPLCARLKEDTEQAMKNLLPISTTSGTSPDEKNQVKFLCSQLHRELLFTMEYNDNAKSELADFCTHMYQSVPSELRYIEELRKNYHAGKTIWWYTRQTFLYKMLNTAFLTQNILILYKFHFFIKDLHMRLEQMHSFYKLSLKEKVFHVYRGLNMPLETFEKTIRAELNNLIAFDSFLSTSLDDQVAKRFALKKLDATHESIVFDIEIDADKMKRPFADISRWSEFKIEKEVLFSIGTVFRIDNVAKEKTSDGIWMVSLSTVSEDDKQLHKETQQIQDTLLEFFVEVLRGQSNSKDERKLATNNANVASMFYKQGEYDKSLEHYDKALKILRKLKSRDPLTEAAYISNVAKVYRQLDNDNEALSLYREALDILRDKSVEANHPALIHTLHTIGDIYQEKEKWTEALEQYTEALKRQLPSSNFDLSSDPSSIAASYICIGTVFYHQKKYQQALDSFLKALEQQHKHLTKEHPVLAFLYNNIGAMYYQIQQYDRALENQLKCLEIELKALPKEHKTFAETYKNIANAYFQLGQLDQAMEFAQKCIDQLEAQQPSEENKKELDDAIYLVQRIQRCQNY